MKFAGGAGENIIKENIDCHVTFVYNYLILMLLSLCYVNPFKTKVDQTKKLYIVP